MRLNLRQEKDKAQFCDNRHMAEGNRRLMFACLTLAGQCWRRVPMQTRCDEFRGHASECQRLAKQFDGLIRCQYEAVARQWLKLAEQAERQAAANGRRRKAA